MAWNLFGDSDSSLKNNLEGGSVVNEADLNVIKFRDKVGSLFDVAEADKGLSWQYEALCSQTDPEAFFPEKGGVTRDRDAKRVCNVCPVQGECLEWALKNDERFGIWGGKSERERRALKAVRLSSSGKMSAKSGLKRANGFGR